MLSTITMIRLGKTYGSLMVDVRASNEKLRARSRRIVALATGAPDAAIEDALTATDGEVKPAILTLLARVDASTAGRLLAAADGHLRVALRSGPHPPVERHGPGTPATQGRADCAPAVTGCTRHRPEGADGSHTDHRPVAGQRGSSSPGRGELRAQPHRPVVRTRQQQPHRAGDDAQPAMARRAVRVAARGPGAENAAAPRERPRGRRAPAARKPGARNGNGAPSRVGKKRRSGAIRTPDPWTGSEVHVTARACHREQQPPPSPACRR